MQKLISISIVILLAYGGLVLAAYLFQRNLQYFPSTARVAPRDAGLQNVRELTLTTPDSETLIAWHALAAPNMPTILYFHGNALGLVDRAERIARYQALGFGFFISAYRGYAGSTGTPSEQALIADAHLIYNHVRNLGVESQDIVLFGESLGTGVATQLAAKVDVGALILESPFTSTADVGSLKYPFLPVHWLMHDQFRSDQHIKKINVPILIVHGEKDKVVPAHMGAEMYDLANDPKEFMLIPESGHIGHDQFGMIQKVEVFLSRHLKSRKSTVE